MDFALAAFLKPVLYFIFYISVVYWLMKLAWRLIPDGKVKRFLFKRR